MAKTNIKNNKTPQTSYRKDELMAELAKISAKDKALRENTTICKDELTVAKQEMLNKVFQAMTDAGVNLNDVVSIGRFLQKLEMRNPDLRELFEQLLGGITEGENVNPAMAGDVVAPEVEAVMPNRLSNLRQSMIQPAE